MKSTLDLRQALQVLNAALGVKATVMQALALVEVARDPGMTVTDLGDKLGVGQPTASRFVMLLSNYGRGGKAGAGLIALVEDRQDRRVKRIGLTERGHRVLRHARLVYPQPQLRENA